MSSSSKNVPDPKCLLCHKQPKSVTITLTCSDCNGVLHRSCAKKFCGSRNPICRTCRKAEQLEQDVQCQNKTQKRVDEKSYSTEKNMDKMGMYKRSQLSDAAIVKRAGIKSNLPGPDKKISPNREIQTLSPSESPVDHRRNENFPIVNVRTADLSMQTFEIKKIKCDPDDTTLSNRDSTQYCDIVKEPASISSKWKLILKNPKNSKLPDDFPPIPQGCWICDHPQSHYFCPEVKKFAAQGGKLCSLCGIKGSGSFSKFTCPRPSCKAMIARDKIANSQSYNLPSRLHSTPPPGPKSIPIEGYASCNNSTPLSLPFKISRSADVVKGSNQTEYKMNKQHTNNYLINLPDNTTNIGKAPVGKNHENLSISSDLHFFPTQHCQFSKPVIVQDDNKNGGDDWESIELPDEYILYDIVESLRTQTSINLVGPPVEVRLPYHQSHLAETVRSLVNHATRVLPTQIYGLRYKIIVTAIPDEWAITAAGQWNENSY